MYRAVWEGGVNVRVAPTLTAARVSCVPVGKYIVGVGLPIADKDGGEWIRVAVNHEGAPLSLATLTNTLHCGRLYGTEGAVTRCSPAERHSQCRACKAGPVAANRFCKRRQGPGGLVFIEAHGPIPPALAPVFADATPTVVRIRRLTVGDHVVSLKATDE